MTRLEKILISYARYHQNKTNRKLHFIGVPTVYLSALIGLLNISLIPRMTAGDLLVILLLLYSFFLSPLLGSIILFPFFALLAVAHILQLTGATVIRVSFIVTFVVGWFFQLWGHRIEGNRPAFLTNFSQVFTAPIFLAAEGLFYFGWNPELQKKMHGASSIGQS